MSPFYVERLEVTLTGSWLVYDNLAGVNKMQQRAIGTVGTVRTVGSEER